MEQQVQPVHADLQDHRDLQGKTAQTELMVLQVHKGLREHQG